MNNQNNENEMFQEIIRKAIERENETPAEKRDRLQNEAMAVLDDIFSLCDNTDDKDESVALVYVPELTDAYAKLVSVLSPVDYDTQFRRLENVLSSVKPKRDPSPFKKEIKQAAKKYRLANNKILEVIRPSDHRVDVKKESDDPWDMENVYYFSTQYRTQLSYLVEKHDQVYNFPTSEQRWVDVLLEYETSLRFVNSQVWSFNGEIYQACEGYLRRFLSNVMTTLQVSSKENGHVNAVLESLANNLYLDRNGDAVQDVFNTQPLIPFLNGVLDLNTGELREYRREDLLSWQLAIKYNENPPVNQAIEKYFATTFADDLDKRNMILAWIGYCLMPFNTDIQRALFLIGNGANGKTLLLNVLHALFREKDLSAVSLVELARDQFAKAIFSRKIVNIVGDLGVNELDSTSDFKIITGYDKSIRAQFKFRDEFTYRPRTKHIFAMNSLPKAGDSSFGYIRRLYPVVFEQQFKESTEGRELEQAMMETPALQYLVFLAINALLDVQESGGKLPWVESSLEIVEEYQKITDTVKAAIYDDEGCLVDVRKNDPQFYTNLKELHVVYKAWCENNGLHPAGPIVFGKKLREAGFKDKKESFGKIIFGVKVK